MPPARAAAGDPGLIVPSNWGRDLVCEVCGQEYRRLRTGHTFASVRREKRGPDPADWVYRRRGGVLGFWHALKVLAWNAHVDACWHYSGRRGRAPNRQHSAHRC